MMIQKVITQFLFTEKGVKISLEIHFVEFEFETLTYYLFSTDATYKAGQVLEKGSETKYPLGKGPQTIFKSEKWPESTKNWRNWQKLTKMKQNEQNFL